jgi:hypothetical protein
MVQFEYKITFQNDPSFDDAWTVVIWERDTTQDGIPRPWRGIRKETVHIWTDLGSTRKQLKSWLRKI